MKLKGDTAISADTYEHLVMIMLNYFQTLVKIRAVITFHMN